MVDEDDNNFSHFKNHVPRWRDMLCVHLYPHTVGDVLREDGAREGLAVRLGATGGGDAPGGKSLNSPLRENYTLTIDSQT